MATYPPTGSASPSTPMGAGNPPNNGRTLNETVILEKAKANLYQKSTVIDMVQFEEVHDDVMLKDRIREDLRFQMYKHLSEHLMFTRTNDHVNDTMTIHARCYVFTKEQLLELVKEATNG